MWEESGKPALPYFGAARMNMFSVGPVITAQPGGLPRS